MKTQHLFKCARGETSAFRTLVSASFAFIVGIGVLGATPTARTQPAQLEEGLAPYVGFLKGQRMSAKDYILSLYDKYDVVVLCERAHPETTQYELVLDVIRDPRFVRGVGHVYTEIGTRSISPEVDALVLKGRRSEAELRAGLQRILLNSGYSFPWDKTNYYDFLRSVHDLNAELPEGGRIQVHPSNTAFVWDGMDAEKYKEFKKTFRTQDRDQMIASHIVDLMEARVQEGKPAPKALVIMNYRHAMPHMEIRKGERTKKINNVAGYLMEAWPGRVANVMINSVALRPDSTDEKASITAISDGKWDAAFALTGNPCIGFDFAGSPFGADKFDYWPVPNPFSYAERFTGFVFWKPLSEHRMKRGVGELIDDAGLKAAAERFAITRGCEKDTAMERALSLRAITSTDYNDPDIFKPSDLMVRITRWLPSGRISRDEPR